MASHLWLQFNYFGCFGRVWLREKETRARERKPNFIFNEHILSFYALFSSVFSCICRKFTCISAHCSPSETTNIQFHSNEKRRELNKSNKTKWSLFFLQVNICCRKKKLLTMDETVRNENVSHTTNSVKFKTVLRFFGGANNKRAKIVTFILIWMWFARKMKKQKMQSVWLLLWATDSMRFRRKFNLKACSPVTLHLFSIALHQHGRCMRLRPCWLCVAWRSSHSKTKTEKEKKVTWGHELSNNRHASESNATKIETKPNQSAFIGRILIYLVIFCVLVSTTKIRIYFIHRQILFRKNMKSYNIRWVRRMSTKEMQRLRFDFRPMITVVHAVRACMCCVCTSDDGKVEERHQSP